jgi:hypothetical protein
MQRKTETLQQTTAPELTYVAEMTLHFDGQQDAKRRLKEVMTTSTWALKLRHAWKRKKVCMTPLSSNEALSLVTMQFLEPQVAEEVRHKNVTTINASQLGMTNLWASGEVVHGNQMVSISPFTLWKWFCDADGDPLKWGPIILVHQDPSSRFRNLSLSYRCHTDSTTTQCRPSCVASSTNDELCTGF